MNTRDPFRPAYAAPPVYHPGPNAALLIDFDNVTMKDVQKDLGKELKSLLDSEVIRGKVAVRRAYADWRRYPSYIVPLTEASVDLIYAPAYGTAKKNATDLRMAIDAIELVFVRPEIGTFILLTGDSDFSSCVLKLKEYGKYVIGVGMRESSSDLLIQNCDEYYSYHALSGLSRAGDDEGVREDPWTLVELAAKQMAARNDAMRTDRLKQVMIELDPGFDEKKLGYSKFSRFATEAAAKGRIRLRKGENGQYEVLVGDAAEPTAAAPRAAESESSDRERGRRGRRGGRGERVEPSRPAPQPVPAAEAETPHVEVVETRPEEAAPVESIATPTADTNAAGGGPSPLSDLQGAYALLQHVVRGMGTRGSGQRDGDVKRRMLDLVPGWDESAFGFSKFSRFLRQAHDDQIVDVVRQEDGSYEVSLPAGGKRLPEPALGAAPAGRQEEARDAVAPPASAPAPRSRRGRGAPSAPPELLPGQVASPPSEEPTPEPTQAAESSAAPARAAAEQASPPQQTESERRVGVRGRRSSRGRPLTDGPPPILEGQVIGAASVPASLEPETQTAAQPQPDSDTPAKKPARTRSRSRGRKKAETPPAAAEFDASALGLPTDNAAIEAYLTNSYRGIGRKTAEALTGAFGSDVFRVMEQEPQRVRETLEDRRADTLLEQWPADLERRRAAAEPAETENAAAEGSESVAEETASPSASDAEPPRSRRRGGRGGRARGRKGEPTPA